MNYKLKLNFVIEELFLPRNMNVVFVSFLKHAFCEFDVNLFNKIFKNDKPIPKTYTFNLNYGPCHFVDDQIELRNKSFSIYLSSYNLEEVIEFYNAMLKQRNKKYQIKNNSITLKNIKLIRFNKNEDSSVYIKMMSPLLLIDHNRETNKNNYIVYSDAEFSSIVKRNLFDKLKKLNIQFNVKDFEIYPLKNKKTVAHSYEGTLPVSIGEFKIVGEPQLLDFLLTSGIGSKTSAGFGMCMKVR